jgi:hypothetical protein
MSIDTRQNRPPPAQERNLDAPQSWNTAADGRRDTGDTRFSVGNSGGRPIWCPEPPASANDENGDTDTEETGRHETPTR